MTGQQIVAKRLEISGVVQGVGFRPFLFGLAGSHNLKGRVSNTPQGVDLVLEGPASSLDRFVRDITAKAPILSRITSIESRACEVKGFSDFGIIKSRGGQSRATLISPDVSTCPDCLAEMKNPSDRRYEYPFINCTNCGPRYTIIRDLPYDRPNTSMAGFQLCFDCMKEYEDPLDRRFHAQPNACPVCGPRVFFTDNSGKELSRNPGAALELAARVLDQGKILAVKGLGGFHLAVDAKNDSAVKLLRERKNRPDKPFALMAASAELISGHVHMDDREKEVLSSFHRPILLLEKKTGNEYGHAGLSSDIAPGNTCLGVMLPYTPLHYLLLEKGPDILVMTSGNRSGHPLSIENQDALDAFSHIADFFLFHDRDIYFRADDSIARLDRGGVRFIRRSRGYAPLPVEVKPPGRTGEWEDLSPGNGKLFPKAGRLPPGGKMLPPILGCGAGLKSTICLTRESHCFLSQHIGDLENMQVHGFYDQTIEHMGKILDIVPRAAAHDYHPGYYSTRYAKDLEKSGMELFPVQHHHAHAVSCMAENKIEGPVIALTLDGTGYGTDGNIWGGEILVATMENFTRAAQLSYVHMPGGDAAVLAPWRMAASLLFKAFGRDFVHLEIPYIKAMDKGSLEFLVQMMEKNLNSPLTSSAGRLFDGISSLLCICHTISHESQAAMELEAAAAGVEDAKSYGFDTIETKGKAGTCYQLDFSPCIREIVHEIKKGRSPSHISARFHITLAAAFTGAALKISRKTGISDIVLSGGVFNNSRILNLVMDQLEEKGMALFTHTKVPCGDGGIALGQVMAAAARIDKRSSRSEIRKDR